MVKETVPIRKSPYKKRIRSYYQYSKELDAGYPIDGKKKLIPQIVYTYTLSLSPDLHGHTSVAVEERRRGHGSG